MAAERNVLTCKDISALATDYSEGHLSGPDRMRFESHVAGCAGCSAWVKQLATTSLVLGALPEPQLPPALRAELLVQFDDWARHRTGAPAAPARRGERAGRARLAPAPALAALGFFGVLVAAARQVSALPRDWGLALLLAGVAAALVLLRPRLTLGSAAAALSAALAVALLAGGPGSLELADALPCVLTVGAAAAGTTGVAWLVLRRGPEALLSEAVGAWAVAGALAGVGGLQVTCGAHTSLPHHLTFHVGSLLVVAAIAAAVSRPRSQAV